LERQKSKSGVLFRRLPSRYKLNLAKKKWVSDRPALDLVSITDGSGWRRSSYKDAILHHINTLMNSPGWADKYIFHAINLMQLPCIFDESTKKKHVYLSIILRVPYDTAPMKNCSMHHATLMCIKANGHAQHICASPYTVRILAVTTHKDNSTNFKLESLAPVLELNNTLPREDNVIEVADNIVAHVRVALFPSFDLAGEPSCTGLNIFFLCTQATHTQ